VLFGSGKAFKTLRQLLVERCDLKAVISATLATKGIKTHYMIQMESVEKHFIRSLKYSQILV